MWKGYFALDNEKKLDTFAFVWVDRDQRYFIFNTSSLKPGILYTRDRFRQFDDSPITYLVCVEFVINQPRVAERYYYQNSKIDESNRTRQDDFKLDKNLQTKDLSIRDNTSILGMNDVYTYYIGKACKWWYDRNPEDLYCNLSEEMIHNWWTNKRTIRN